MIIIILRQCFGIFFVMYQFYFLYYFPRTAVTNYQQLDGLEQQKSILLQFWRLEIQNQGVDRAALPPKVLEENPSCVFQLLVAPGIP